MKKLVVMFLIVFLLSACTDKLDNQLNNNSVSNSHNIKENIVESGIPLYQKNRLELPNDEVFVLCATKSEDILYLYTIVKPGDYLFYAYDRTGNSCVQLDIPISGTVQSMDSRDDFLYILVNEADEMGNAAYKCTEFNTTTQETRSITLDKEIYGEDQVAITGFSVVGDQFYVNAVHNMYRLDSDGKINAKLELENVWRGPIYSPDQGSLVIYRYKDNDFFLQEINPELQFSKKYILGAEYNEVFPGLSPNQIFVTDGNQIYSLDLATGDKKPYVSILLHNLNFSSFIPLSDQSFFTIQDGVPTLWTSSTEELAGQPAILKCATYNVSDEMKNSVSVFNYRHDTIKIDLIDYSVYDDGLTRLLVELAAGKVPDILDLSAVPFTGLASLGLLQNLEEYLSGKDIVPNIRELLKSDDGIYQFVPAFQIAAMASSDKYIVSSRFNMETLLDLAEKAKSEGKSLFPQYTTKEDFISFILAFSGDSFVDIERDYCNFEDELFASLMQFSLELPAEDELNEDLYAEFFSEEFESVLEDKQIISVIETGNPVYELLKLRGLYRDNIEFIGFPTNAGNGIAMTPFIRIGMSATSSLKDEIWTFFDFLLSEEYQLEMSRINYMPVVNAYLDADINRVIKKYTEEPLKLAIFLDNGIMTLDCPLVDDETASDVWTLIRRVDCINQYDTTIYQIILEESQSFFAGDKKISDVLSAIQGRVSLYVHEKQ